MTKVKDSVKREIIVQAPIKKVWDALTKEEHLNRWYTKEATIDFRIGGKGFLSHGWGATTEGVYTEIVRHERFVIQSLDGDFQTITELEEVENGVRVRITYQATFLADMEKAAKENMLFGTAQFLENLKAVYETGEDNRDKFWRVWIGISHATDELVAGTKVLHVKEESAAFLSGILPGDVVIQMDDETVLGYESFERLLNAKEVNQSIVLKILRGEDEIDLVCPLEKYPVPY